MRTSSPFDAASSNQESVAAGCEHQTMKSESHVADMRLIPHLVAACDVSLRLVFFRVSSSWWTDRERDQLTFVRFGNAWFTPEL